MFWVLNLAVLLIAFLVVGPSKLAAQNVEKDSTVWVGEWRDTGNLQYAFTLKLKPLGEGRFSGVFEWKLIWTSLSEHKPKVGAIAKESVVGRYNPADKSFNLVGIKQDDPADIISMDHYLINVSADGKRMEGINVKPENYHGNLFGVIQPPKKPTIAASTKPNTPKNTGNNGAVNSGAKPAVKPVTPPVPVVKPVTPTAKATDEPTSAAKELQSREIVTKTQLRSTETQVKIRIFDESLIDGDVVSLSWNGIWVLRYYRVAKLPRELVLDLAPGENTLVMHAENLGKYPPNTAAISVSRGSKTDQFILNSDMGKSEAIKIVRE